MKGWVKVLLALALATILWAGVGGMTGSIFGVIGLCAIALGIGNNSGGVGR